MKRKLGIFGVFLLAALMVLFLGACGQKQGPGAGQPATDGKTSGAPQKSEHSITIVTTGMGSTSYTMVVGIADIIQKKTGMSVSVQPLGGADAIINALLDKKAELGTPNATGSVNAFYGRGQFAGLSKAPIRLVMQYMDSPRYLLVRASSGIKTLADLRGKTIIGKRRAVADIEIATNAYLQIAGVPKDQVKVVEATDVSESLNALRMGSVDAVLMVQSPKGPGVQELSQAIDVRVLGIPKDKIQEMKTLLGPGFRTVTYPPGTVKGQDEPLISLATPMILVARADVSSDVVYNVIKTIVDNYADVKLIHAEAEGWTAENTLNDPPIPFHDGAVKFFKERNLWTKELEAWQNKTLEAQK